MFIGPFYPSPENVTQALLEMLVTFRKSTVKIVRHVSCLFLPEVASYAKLFYLLGLESYKALTFSRPANAQGLLYKHCCNKLSQPSYSSKILFMPMCLNGKRHFDRYYLFFSTSKVRKGSKIPS